MALPPKAEQAPRTLLELCWYFPPSQPLQVPNNCSAASRWGSALDPGAAGMVKGMGASEQPSGVSLGRGEWVEGV